MRLLWLLLLDVLIVFPVVAQRTLMLKQFKNGMKAIFKAFEKS